MKRLPAGLADPLHMEVLIPWKTIFIVAGVLLLMALTLWLVRLWRRHRRNRPAPPASAPPPLPETTIADAIEAVRLEHRKKRTFRAACHELSTLLRRHFESGGKHRYSTLTAGEIRTEVGESVSSRFFSFLAELQFRRDRPTGNDLEGACDLALDVARREPTQGSER